MSTSLPHRQEVAEAPLRVLRQQTKQVIAAHLDSRKLLLSNSKLHRDWRGLAVKANLDISIIRSSKISSTEHCLHIWSEKGGFIQDLWDALKSMDRYDVIDDTLEFIYNDYDYALSQDCLKLRPIPPSLDKLIPDIADFDSNAITGDPHKFYDALVLFADEDLDFVKLMVEKLEGEYNLKLCLKDRDLLGGLHFELSAVMSLIELHCARVIVVLSAKFLESNANKFFTQFALALSIDQRRRIVIPCMFEPCKKPPEISYCHSLDYFRTQGYWDYWEKLVESIKYKSDDKRSANTLASGPVIQDISTLSSPSSVTTSSPTNTNQISNGVFSRLKKRNGKLSGVYSTSVSSENSNKFKRSSSSEFPIKADDIFVNLPNVPSTLPGESNISPGNSSAKSNFKSTAVSIPPLPSSSSEGSLKDLFRKALHFKRKKRKVPS